MGLQVAFYRSLSLTPFLGPRQKFASAAWGEKVVAYYAHLSSPAFPSKQHQSRFKIQEMNWFALNGIARRRLPDRRET